MTYEIDIATPDRTETFTVTQPGVLGGLIRSRADAYDTIRRELSHDGIGWAEAEAVAWRATYDQIETSIPTVDCESTVRVRLIHHPIDF